jgi:hypothetical protein
MAELPKPENDVAQEDYCDSNANYMSLEQHREVFA